MVIGKGTLPERAERYFTEWASRYLDRFFMILDVHADESQIAGNIVVIGGYMATPEEWAHAIKRWRTVLKNHRVKHFHFRQFNSRDDCLKPSSPYYEWSWKRRDAFFYDLSMSIGQSLVPVGGDYFLEGHRKDGLASNPYEELFKTFFWDVKAAASRHFPKMTCKEDKIHFICDANPNKNWTTSFKKVHGLIQNVPLIGSLSFGNDEHAEFCGLQIADLFVAIYRQNASEKRKTGMQRKRRIIDYIMFRNLGDSSQKNSNFSFMLEPAFEVMIDAMRIDEHRQKREWEKNGVSDQKYYPEDHTETIEVVAKKIGYNRRTKFIQWMQSQKH